jgi:Cu/Zn superoxide dismutase
MRSTILTVLAAASVASAQSSTITPAPVVTGNPSGASYIATLPAKAGSPLAGSIMAVSGAGGTGVKYTVKFSGLPDAGGPFLYHIHEKAVPENGNCTATGAHLDPYKRGEVPPCDATKPETCQTGDLSGKYGLITAKEWSVEYVHPHYILSKDSSY